MSNPTTQSPNSDELKAGQCAEHYFSSYNVPNCPLWVSICSHCQAIDANDLNQQLNAYILAEVLPMVGHIPPQSENWRNSNELSGKYSERLRIANDLTARFGGKT